MDPVGTLIPWLAAYGVAALAAATFIERLVPIVPSYAVLVVIGITAAEGHFSLAVALVLSTGGSVLGAAALYALGAALGETRSRALLGRLGRWMGMPTSRTDWWLDQFRSSAHWLVLCAQLVPTVRLITPGISGLLRTRFWAFAGATTIGVALWNGLFIAVGYIATHGDGEANASVLALKTLAILLACEGVAALVWRARARRRQVRDSQDRSPSSGGGSPPHPPGDLLPFARAWLVPPLRVAAGAPSERALANLITGEINAASAPFIELCAGTGSFTRALVARGVSEDRLILVETDAVFAPLLRSTFPRARILPIDARRLRHLEDDAVAPARAAVSGLPILSLPPRAVMAILDATFDGLRPDGALLRFTYCPLWPIPRLILDRLGLKAVRIGGTLANLPPASVYRITRRPLRTRVGA